MNEEDIREEVKVLEAKIERVEQSQDLLSGVPGDMFTDREIWTQLQQQKQTLKRKKRDAEFRLGILKGEIEAPPGHPEWGDGR